MYLKSITLDGFKSYGQRTVISGFDPFFNAITGLNGSGKSNILDSICFLLGISNLSQVRATNLQELVYKNGQAGITKASVSITFDNFNKEQSPIGYDQYDEITVTRQIIIGGQNKYLINGCTATNARVKDLFQSVQLNVNNPHFLIMQGRITKVLNMKPIEILSMIEEAAGTKMYETKKQASLRTVEAKDSKLREINAILDEEITPTLTKLKDERAAFLEYQKIQRELEHLTKLCVAYQYVVAQDTTQKYKNDLAKTEENIKVVVQKIEALETNSKELEKKINQLVKEKSAESEGVLTKLQETVISREKMEAKVATAIKNMKDTLKAEEKKIVTLGKQKNEDSTSMKTRENALNALVSELQEIKEASIKDADAVNAAEKRYQAVSSGLSANADGQDATLADQLITAKTEIAAAESEIKQAQMTLKHSTGELKKKETDLKKTEKEYETDKKDLVPLQKAIERIENEIQALNYQEGLQEQLTTQKHGLQQHASQLNNRYETLLSKFPQLDFEYSDPTPNFDRSKVKGVLCNLFTMKDQQMATALEVVAGGRLFNVVVDNEETGKQILSRGNLRKRHTIIPLNKISGYPVAPNVIRRAENLVGKNVVYPALSLVSYPPNMKAAMEFAFGNTLVCMDPRVAKTVAFDRDIMKRTVTLDGDVYDPAGTLTGGSRRPGEPFLAALTEIKEVKIELDNVRNQVNDVCSKLAEVSKVFGKFSDLKQQLDIKQRQAELVNERLLHTVHHQMLEQVNVLKQSIEEQEATLSRCRESVAKNVNKAKELENKIKNYKSVHEAELKEAEANMKKCKKQAEASLKVAKDKEQAIDVLKLELDELKSGLENYDEQVKAVETVMEQYNQQLTEMETKRGEAQETLKEAQEALTQQKELLKLHNQEISTLKKKESQLKQEVNDNKLGLKDLQQNLSQYQNGSKDAANKLQDLIKAYDWIAEEKKYFGQPNTAYDFKANDPKEASHRLQKMREKKEELSKNVNMRAMSMLDRTEEQYNDLIKKKEIVEKDKQVIASVIRELDEKKKEALQTAWVKVNKDFGSIFSTLLPGTQAKLLPINGKCVLDGLEVKVAFGNKWKESLNELSGGQRSLVALSIILALLLFKPAPIYILDEVDAALDLSHTQNIGNMLRTHFKHSQFIIVSLKDGMFNNANVLFKTKFVDGMSTVTRHTQSQAHK